MITLTTKKLDDYSKLIKSQFTEAESQKDAQSSIGYAYKKWEKSWKSQYDKLQSNYQEQLQDYIEEQQIILANKQDNGAVVRIQRGETTHNEYTAENEIQLINSIKQKGREVNAAFDEEVIDFEPFFLSDINRIEKFDQFTKEELQGIFIV